MDTIENVSPSKDLVAIDTLNPIVVFGDGGVDAVLEKLRKEVRAIPIDISTPAGRKAIASLAYKVARSKTALDEMGKNLVADWKVKAAAVDAERKRIRDDLDALRDEVRKPLDDWENAEKARVEAHEAALADITRAATFAVSEPSVDEIKSRINCLRKTDPRDWQEFTKRATDARAVAIASLTALHETTVKREAERAELERLRQAEIARQQQERDDRLRAEAAEKARREAEAKAEQEAKTVAETVERERRRIEAEKEAAEAAAIRAERERIAAAERAAAEAAELARQVEADRLKAERDIREAEDRAAQAENDRLAAISQAQADAEIKARQVEEDRRAAAERAGRDRRAAIEAERQRVVDAARQEAEATAERESNKRHRAKINNEALAALVAAGLSEQASTAAITAIARGEVPHVKILY